MTYYVYRLNDTIHMVVVRYREKVPQLDLTFKGFANLPDRRRPALCADGTDCQGNGNPRDQIKGTPTSNVNVSDPRHDSDRSHDEPDCITYTQNDCPYDGREKSRTTYHIKRGRR